MAKALAGVTERAADFDETLDFLRRLNKRIGQTILMITHNPEAAAYADRTVTMRDGRIHV
jgi:putative ABC transport system ATP-binding protein